MSIDWSHIPDLGPKDYTPERNPIAPEGYVWQCQACGKIAKNRYGQEGSWDEACMLNAELVERTMKGLSHD